MKNDLNSIKKWAAQIEGLNATQKEILERKIAEYEEKLTYDELDNRLDRFFMDWNKRDMVG